MQEWVHGEIARRHIQQYVVVIRAQKRRDRDNAVAAGPVLDHHGLAPELRQLFSEQSRADVGGGARSERHDEPDRSRRPGRRLRVRYRSGNGKTCKEGANKGQDPKSHHDVLAFKSSEQSRAIRSSGPHASPSSGAPALLRSARSTASGVSGNSISRTPTASSMAFATAGDTHSVADSPAPLAPNGALC